MMFDSSLPPVFCRRPHVLLCFLCVYVCIKWCPTFCPIKCFYILSSVLWCLLRFPHKNNVCFVFTSSSLLEGSCLIYVIYVYLHIVVSNTYCVVVLFCLSSSCVLCTQCCQFFWIVHSWLPLRFSLVYLHLPMQSLCVCHLWNWEFDSWPYDKVCQWLVPGQCFSINLTTMK